jgi:hypothetical protein
VQVEPEALDGVGEPAAQGVEVVERPEVEQDWSSPRYIARPEPDVQVLEQDVARST